MATLMQCKGCGKEISKQAPACPSCGHPNKGKHLSAGSVLLSFLALALFLWWLAPSGGGKAVMSTIHDQVAEDALKQYEIAKRSGDRIQICVHAGMVTAAYMQAQDEANYRSWLARQNKDCEAAGMPTQ